jgi:hypothetical protein
MTQTEAGGLKFARAQKFWFKLSRRVWVQKVQHLVHFHACAAGFGYVPSLTGLLILFHHLSVSTHLYFHIYRWHANMIFLTMITYLFID